MVAKDAYDILNVDISNILNAVKREKLYNEQGHSITNANKN